MVSVAVLDEDGVGLNNSFVDMENIKFVFNGTDADFILHLKNGILTLKDCNSSLPPIYVEFESSRLRQRRENLSLKQDLLRAVGAKSKPTILDATAGMGKDSFIMLCAGLEVCMLERNPIIFKLLQNGIERAKKDLTLSNVFSKSKLYNVEAVDFLENTKENFNVIYLDPMFPETKKSRLVKKDMQVFHKLLGSGDDAKLFKIALEKANKKVVVKRPLHSPHLADLAPTSKIIGRSIRFDIYAVPQRGLEPPRPCGH